MQQRSRQKGILIQLHLVKSYSGVCDAVCLFASGLAGAARKCGSAINIARSAWDSSQRENRKHNLTFARKLHDKSVHCCRINCIKQRAPGIKAVFVFSPSGYLNELKCDHDHPSNMSCRIDLQLEISISGAKTLDCKQGNHTDFNNLLVAYISSSWLLISFVPK
jgi:hypothetical protein